MLSIISVIIRYIVMYYVLSYTNTSAKETSLALVGKRRRRGECPVLALECRRGSRGVDYAFEKPQR